ncbi:SHOCT domain-containing protein [Cognatiluteimonas weifangensis]|uniref:SHOCT domain-containing protein n=1 Tax=Cognatiluteimonas weifangensis TaxID=2303539 RepID=A0A372DMJ7_9GAMM|nr:SHOCT domain-containing protein [Luteimonas weifangensis]RFP60793.1 SHOCT domain-containing protein [Luteimonas weifangensis]
MKRAIALALVLLCPAAFAGNTGVIPDGPDSYLIMRTGKTGFVSSSSLQKKAYEEASQFCQSKSLVMQTISMTSKRARPLGGFPEATLRFRCVGQAGSASQSAPTPGSGDKYIQLERLKGLLDSGALTQDEFDREKAKILAQ